MPCRLFDSNIIYAKSGMLIRYGRLNPDFVIILLTFFQFKNHFVKNKNIF